MSSHGNLHTVAERYNWRCWYCGGRVRCATCDPSGTVMPATRDHRIPRAQGGGRGVNLVAACLRCNQLKADRLPGEPPKRRREPREGCHAGRTSAAARRKRPLKPFATQALAQAMCDVVNAQKGADLQPWECPYCNQWHIALAKHIREPRARGLWEPMRQSVHSLDEVA